MKSTNAFGVSPLLPYWDPANPVKQPWLDSVNTIVKRPKIYLRDSGMFHTLMNIDDEHQLKAHPKLGASFEGFALECICRELKKNDNDIYFYRVHAGSELDLFWQRKGKNWGAQFKYSDAPKLTRSMSIVINDLEIEHLWVVHPGKKTYRLAENITVLPLSEAETLGS